MMGKGKKEKKFFLIKKKKKKRKGRNQAREVQAAEMRPRVGAGGANSLQDWVWFWVSHVVQSYFSSWREQM